MLAVFSIAMPVFALILTGWLAGRTRLLGADSTEAMNLFVVWLALPAVLFRAMAQIHPADLLNVGLLASFGLGIAVPFVVSLFWSRRQGVALGNSAIQALSATYCNVGYMGIPLCLMAFGEASVVPGVITMVITACVQFGAAIVLIEIDRPGQIDLWRTIRRIAGTLACNPLLISPIAGLLVAMVGLSLPLAIDRFLVLLGGAATPCALVATGLMLGETTERFRPALVARLVALKLLLQPAIAWVVAFQLLTLPPAWGETAVIMSALPTGAGAFILAKLYGREAASTSGAVLVSTILSFATLSLLLAWLI
ncbi:MAG: AEC family transporter [Rhodospirillales bacterium]